MAGRKKTTKMPEMKDFPSVRKGDRNGYVTLVQTNLLNRGYYIGKNGVDGNFDDALQKAVKEFQKDAGMPVPTGSVGPKTWAALQESKVQKMPQPVKVMPKHEPEPVADMQTGTPAGNCRVLIEGLTRYQAELLVKLFKGSTECRIL